MKSDKRGCSTCKIGKESYEFFDSPYAKTNIQYDYRALNGELFSCVRRAQNEETALLCARSAKDFWLHSHGWAE